MCRLSIIIPLVTDGEQFEDTLVSVLQNRPGKCEVLVVHRGPYADPYELHQEVRFLEVEADAAVVAMLNAGCDVASGEIIHVLLPGVLAQPGWTQPAIDRFQETDVAAVAPVTLLAENPDRIAAAGIRFTVGGRRVPNGAGRRIDRSSRHLRREIVGPALNAGFYRRTVMESLGGFDESCGSLWSDVDLGLSLQTLGYQCVLEPQSVVHGPSSRVELSLGYRAGRRAERVFWRHIASGPWGLRLALHPLAVAATVVRAWNQFAAYSQLSGRLVSLLGIFSHLAHGSRLRQRASVPDEEYLAETTDYPAEPPTGHRSERRPMKQKGNRAA